MKIGKYIKRGIQYILHGVPIIQRPVNVVALDTNSMLAGKTALITGGSSGIGLSLAIAFVNSGANVIITGRNSDKLKEAVEVIKENSKRETDVFFSVMDISQISSIESAFKDIINLIGHNYIDILVNNAGVAGGDISCVCEDEFDKIINTNLKGTFFLSRIVSKYMIENQIKGNILNIASSSSLRPAASAYTLSKWGIRGFTLGLAKTLTPYDIVVNGIAPGPSVTTMQHASTSDISFSGPASRMVMPEEIANMAIFLVAETGRMIIGDIIYMTGGSGVITFDDVTYKI